MRKTGKIYIHFLFLMVLCIPADISFSQELKNINLKERFSVITDRSLYTADEYIYFTVCEASSSDIAEEGLSKVLYVDLISPDGQIVKSSKYPFHNRKTHSAIRIPAETPSGTWYLRVYSKWLRNYEVNDMSYASVKIVNPATLDHLPVDTKAGDDYVLSFEDKQDRIEGLTIFTDKDEYGKREEVSLILENLYGNSISEFSLSVVPAAAAMNQIKNIPNGTYIEKNPDFLPEIRELSLSGKVRNVNTGEFEPFAHVFLTLLDPERNFYPGITDSSGSFNFSLPPYTGKRDLFISVRGEQGDSLEVLVDNDFAAEHKPLPSTRLDLDSTEYALALEIIRNQQLKAQYYPDTFQYEEESRDEVPFYGEPARSVEISEYIDLPNLEEYFLELLPMVRVIRSQGRLAFRINGPQAEMNIYDPAVMVDGVAMHDNKAVLEIDPRRIRKIDVIDRPYLRGDVLFGGIISILSREDDFAGVDLPGSGLFLTYRFYEPGAENPQSFLPEEKNLPDPRNTLYWNPSLILKRGEEKQIKFRTSDNSGKYKIIVSGVNEEGKVVRNTSEFRVE